MKRWLGLFAFGALACYLGQHSAIWDRGAYLSIPVSFLVFFPGWFLVLIAAYRLPWNLPGFVLKTAAAWFGTLLLLALIRVWGGNTNTSFALGLSVSLVVVIFYAYRMIQKLRIDEGRRESPTDVL